MANVAMLPLRCRRCDGPIQRPTGPGRPPTICPDCRARARWQARIGLAGTIADHLDGFVVHLTASHRSPATVYRYRLAAAQLGEFLGGPDVTEITTGDIERFVAHSLETAAGSTAAGRVVSLQQFFRYLERELDDDWPNPMAGVRAPAFEDPPVDPIPTGFLATLIAQAGKEGTFAGLRDTAILRLFVDTGGRLEEITGLTLSDVIGDEVHLVGKAAGAGKRARTVIIGAKARKALQSYLRARLAHPRAGDTTALWLGLRGPMTPSGVRQMVWRRSAAAGMRIKPHQFRHTFAHLLKSDDTVRDETIRQMAGWSPTSRMLDRYAKAVAHDRAMDAMRRRGAIGDQL